MLPLPSVGFLAQATTRREIYWNVPGWAQFLLYVLFFVAAGVLVFGLYERSRAWCRGRVDSAAHEASAGARWRSGLARLWRHALLQVRIWRSPMAGLSHAAIFWGFIVLFIGTCIVAVEEYGSRITGQEPFFFYGSFYLLVSCALEVFGLIFLYGLVLALLRRRADRRFRPLARPVDSFILWLFLALGVSGFLVEGLRIAASEGGMEAVEFERWSFVGWLIALAFEVLDDSLLRTLHLAAWLVHMAMSMFFIAILPYCKLRHIFLSSAHLATAVERQPGKYAGVSMEEVEESGRYGAAVPEDFTRGQLRSFDACTECARCQSVCPAHATGKPLSPMQVVLDIGQAASFADPQASLHGEPISAETLWSCTSCGACVEECPVAIDQLAAIVDLRRHLVGEGEIRGSQQAALRSIAASSNPWGLPENERDDWRTQLIDSGLVCPTIDEVPDAEILYWVGCAGAYDRQAQKVVRAMVEILGAAGVRFVVLGKKERCTGDPARRLGDEFTYVEAATENVARLQATGVRRIVASCPHCLNTLGKEYPELGGEFDVVHHSAYIDELIAAGRLQLESASESDAERVVYHDPCYLGRLGGTYDEPRRAIEATGAELHEVESSRERGFCCGAGGGRMWMEETVGERVNETRFRQLKVLAPKTVAVGCPFCKTMLRDAAIADGEEVEVRDLAELVAERLPRS